MGVRVNPSAGVLAELGGVMRGDRAPYYMPGYVGPLSIKTMSRGRGLWRTTSGTFVVEPGRALILSSGQRYSLTIEGEQEIGTFCPFFAPSLVREAVRARTRDAAHLLDRPYDERVPVPGFVERLRPLESALTGALRRLERALQVDVDDQDSAFLDLLDVVLDATGRDMTEAGRLPARRASTREQLYRQVYRAVDFAHANLAAPLDLAALAKVAAMSPYHFHRTFRALLGLTPARYLTEARLLRARTLLDSTTRTVTEICGDVGFASLGSFSSRFTRAFGVSASRYRRDSQAGRSRVVLRGRP